MLGLIDFANSTKRQPISIVALHLVELSSHPSILVIHSATTATTDDHGDIHSEHPPPSSAASAIFRAFSSYAENADSVSVRGHTAASPYHTMHEDIMAMAEDFGAALIILPFHKHHTVDGGMEATNPSLRSLNRSVLASAPCSVAILIDRGLLPHPRQIALFFLGGPDDREALALASRVAGHGGFSLTILRLILPEFSDESTIDNEYIIDFRLRHGSHEAIVFAEAEATTAEDTVAALRSFVNGGHDLYIVGKRGGRGTRLTTGLTDWSECPELGPIGDLLASPDLNVSVLVVQQFCSITELTTN